MALLYKNKSIIKYGEGDVMSPLKKPTSNEPTLQDYLKVYNSSIELENNLKKYPNYRLVDENKLGNNDSWKERLFEAKFSYDDWHNPKSKYIKKYLSNPRIPTHQKKQILENMKNYNLESYYKQETPYNFYQRELSVGVLNKDLPMTYYDTRIRPTSQQRYEGTLEDNSGKIIDGVELFKYDPKTVREEALKIFPGAEKEFEKIDRLYTTPIASTESKPVVNTATNTIPTVKPSSTPAGWQPFSVNGRVLDPEIYGYGESVNNRPLELAQFASSYLKKDMMDQYKKSGKYPWQK
jgi:hypothetical protein